MRSDDYSIGRETGGDYAGQFGAKIGPEPHVIGDNAGIFDTYLQALEWVEGKLGKPCREVLDAVKADAARIIDAGGPEGGRYWRIITDHAADDSDIRAAVTHARVTGSVGCTYNGAKVERVPGPKRPPRTAYESELGEAAEDAAAAKQ